MGSAASSDRIRAVLFDLDGTLVDSLRTILAGLGDTLERFAGFRPRPEALQSLVGLPLSAQVVAFDQPGGAPVDVQERVRFAEERFEHHASLERVFPCTEEILMLCRRASVPSAIVTSKTRSEFQSFRTRHPWVDLVDAVVCSTDVPRGKPEPDSALCALRRLGVEGGRSVLVGDSTFDMECGRRAGCEVWAVAYGAGSLQALLGARPDRVLADQTELLRALEQEVVSFPCPARN
ncbi:MAG: HAD family hydrolase [Fimbriimonadales bacterium]|nr:HAD family hydrolase [Fimbriimonadales bacterium]